jgi:hypothetical protein
MYKSNQLTAPLHAVLSRGWRIIFGLMWKLAAAGNFT